MKSIASAVEKQSKDHQTLSLYGRNIDITKHFNCSRNLVLRE